MQHRHLLYSRAASHASASSSSSSRAPCPPSPASALRWQRHRDAPRPALARKERAATLRVSLQRFLDAWRRSRVFFFLVVGAGISLKPSSTKTTVPTHANNSSSPRTLRDRGETRCSSRWITR